MWSLYLSLSNSLLIVLRHLIILVAVVDFLPKLLSISSTLEELHLKIHIPTLLLKKSAVLILQLLELVFQVVLLILHKVTKNSWRMLLEMLDQSQLLSKLWVISSSTLQVSTPILPAPVLLKMSTMQSLLPVMVLMKRVLNIGMSKTHGVNTGEIMVTSRSREVLTCAVLQHVLHIPSSTTKNKNWTQSSRDNLKFMLEIS